MVVPDATQDARFAANPLVTGEFGLRFYAGAPLKARDGFNLGSLCIIDTQPREFSHEQRAALSDLAAMVVDEMELRVTGEKLRVEVAESHRRQEALQAAEARTQQIVETAHNAFVSMDAGGLITGWNRDAETIFGWPREEAIGRPLAETIIPLSFREAHWRGLQKFLETGQGPVLNQIFEISALRRDGTEFPIELSISPLRWGDTYAFTAFVRDITERKQSEAALERQTIALQEQAELLDLAHDSIIVVDWGGIITFWNKGAERMYGWSQAEALAQNAHQLLHVQLARPLEDIKEVLLREGLWEGEAIHTSRDKTPITVATRWVLKRDAKGRAAAILKISNDITARKAAEAELQHEQEFLKVLLESTQEGIVACDADGSLTLFNRATREFHGLPAQGVPAEEWAEQYDLYLADGQTPMQTADIPLFRALQGEVIHDVEMVIAPKIGASRSLLANGQSMFDENGRKLGAVVTMHDITARKAAEEELRQSKRFAESIADNSTSIIYLFDLQKRANVYANRDVIGFLGYSAEQVKALGGDILPAIIHPDDLALLSSHLDSFQTRRDGEVVEFETRIRHADGAYRWIASRETIFKRHPDGTPWQILGNSIDITPRKEAETALQAVNDELEMRVARRTDALAQANVRLHESRDQLQGILDNTTSVVYLKDLEGHYLLVNRQFETLFNATREQLIGKTDYDLFPADMADIFAANDQKILAINGVLELEEEAPQPDGIHTFISTKFPLRDADGKTYAVCGISTDITERKRGEVALQVAKEEAERANASKDEFLSRMSHELRTPLNAILGFGQILEMQQKQLRASHNESVQQILKAGRHQLDLVNEVLDITRINAPDSALSPEAVDLGEVVQEALDMVQALATPTGISLSQHRPDAPPIFVLADRQRLLQILLNLLANAIKFNKPGGQVRVSAEVWPEHRVRFHVRDTGHGIAAADLPKLFVPFSRLNAEELGVEGTGLGLVLCQRLSQAMNGSLHVESQPGLGSTFSVELPQAQPPLRPLPSSTASTDSIPSSPGLGSPVAPSATAPLATAPLAEHTILLIEDNISNFQLIERVLKDLSDVRLVGAMQGRLGVELAIHHRPELILLDLHLPDIMGDEVLRRLKARPETQNIPVIVLSADATPSQISRLLALGARQYLTKPLNMKQFLQALKETIYAC